VAVGVATGEAVGVGEGVGVALGVGDTVGVGVGPGVGVGVAFGSDGNGQTYAPRLRVQSDNVVNPRSYCMSQIIACGGPFWKRSHVGFATLISSV